MKAFRSPPSVSNRGREIGPGLARRRLEQQVLEQVGAAVLLRTLRRRAGKYPKLHRDRSRSLVFEPP